MCPVVNIFLSNIEHNGHSCWCINIYNFVKFITYQGILLLFFIGHIVPSIFYTTTWQTIMLLQGAGDHCRLNAIWHLSLYSFATTSVIPHYSTTQSIFFPILITSLLQLSTPYWFQILESVLKWLTPRKFLQT